jgi:lipid A 3-O-deacylase
MSRKSFSLLLVVFALGAASVSRALTVMGPPTMPVPPRWELEYSTGVLWKVGGGATPLSYTVLPQIISFKIPPISETPKWGGTLVLRSRFSLLLEPILHGPEHSFLGVAAAGELEWRSRSQRFVGFFASGGGFGWLDSKGYEVPGGQGQDFNLNWLIHSGVRFRMRDDWWTSLGLYFQHVSNRGMDKVNPGLNALGPTLAISRKF